MSGQLSIFPECKCDVCGRMVGPSAKNPYLFDGFRDVATGCFVCWPCKPEYDGHWWDYYARANPEWAHLHVPPKRLFQEMPERVRYR